MRKKVSELAATIWTIAKNPVGSVIIGGVSGSAATHLFSKSKIVQDLEQAQADCNKFEKRVSKLEDLNSDLLSRNDKLRDELRQTDRNANFVRSQLTDYKHRVNNTITAYKNSWCFWRYHIDKSETPTSPSDKSSTHLSELTR